MQYVKVEHNNSKVPTILSALVQLPLCYTIFFISYLSHRFPRSPYLLPDQKMYISTVQWKTYPYSENKSVPSMSYTI